MKEGSVIALYYAGRLTQFPQALFGTAVATVSLPLMSSSSLSSGFDKMRDVLGTGIRMVLLTILPASVGLMILARPIVALLFERGQFTVAATAMTSWALLFYATGLIGYAGVSLMTASFYSLKDTKTPVKIAAFCMVLNIVLNLILMGPLQVGGLALASAVASFANLSLLMLFLKKRIGGLGIKNILPSFLKMLLASSLLAAFCAGSHGFFKGGSRLVHMGITIPLGILVYVLTLYLLKCEEITKITKRGRFLS